MSLLGGIINGLIEATVKAKVGEATAQNSEPMHFSPPPKYYPLGKRHVFDIYGRDVSDQRVGADGRLYSLTTGKLINSLDDASRGKGR